jgi:choline monooxygenase
MSIDNITGAMHALETDIARATGMPPGYYTNNGHFEIEKKFIFANNWCCIGFASDIPKIGDMKPIVFAGYPLFFVRDTDNSIKVFHNFCPHRGTRLVSEEQNRTLVRCPYHAWSFSLCGALIRAPHHETCDRSKFGLREAHSATWQDAIFVNLSGNAPPLEKEIAPLLRRWNGFDFSLLRRGGGMTYCFRSNWKLIVENFLECYHVPSVHPNLSQYSKFSDRYSIIFEKKFFGIGSKIYKPNAISIELPRWPGISDEREFQAEYISLFPNILIGRMPDHAFIWMLEPISPSETIEHLRFYFIGQESVSDIFKDERNATLARWKEVNDEDFDIVQRLFAGHESPAYDGARFAPSHEETIHEFHRMVLATLNTSFEIN